MSRSASITTRYGRQGSRLHTTEALSYGCAHDVEGRAGHPVRRIGAACSRRTGARCETETGETACGLAVEGLIVSDQDWEATSMDRCPTCVEEVATPE